MKKQPIQLLLLFLVAMAATGSVSAFTPKQQHRLTNAIKQSQVYSEKISSQFDQFTRCLSNPSCSSQQLKDLAKEVSVNLGTLKATLKIMKILGSKQKSGMF